MKSTLVIGAALASSALAANPIWGGASYPECTACLDRTFATCPGNWETQEYAECLCAGAGSSVFIDCVGTCQLVDTMGIGQAGIVTSGFYAYCLSFFPSELCEGAKDLVTNDTWQSYDFVIAGGGTSGLTVADRLTERFPDKTVLVIEYGDVEYAPGIFDPPQIAWGGSGPRASSWSLVSTPSPALNNNTVTLSLGKVVGGSSAVNGMFFDRGSRFDYDTWDALQGNRSRSRIDWSWNGIYPYFKKSTTFTPPREETVQQYGYTWDAAVWGNTTPIYASLPPFLWGDHLAIREAYKEMGIAVSRECAGGDKEGLCWIPTSAHPVTFRRSYAGTGHYADVIAQRPNYHLLVKHQAVRVVYPENDVRSGPPFVEVRPVDGGPAFNVSAKNEVVISAGAIGTPAVLQRSGIGPADFLQSANIPVVLDLPGVGSNFQDHAGPRVQWTYTEPLPFYPLPTDMQTNATFAAEAAAGFNKTPAEGPYTLAMSTSSIWIPLPNVTADYETIISTIRELADEAPSREALHLPDAYGSDETLIAGYRAQLRQLADQLANPHSASLESTWGTGSSISCIMLHPLSRGTVRLDPRRPLELPVVDYRSASNPIDITIHMAHTRFLRRVVHTEVVQGLGGVEVTPGEAAQTDEQLEAFVRRNTAQSYMHPCCTAAMLPKEWGGVVATDLKVYGAKGLRVVDLSIMPVLPGAHTSATAYAVGEKAADIIIREWSREKDD
ncbi:hypothetical protein VTJ49DRAFT_405 [Mycothermus thermophilus]|uniref:Glucose-methanol-choline oxidoreductase N-terminal domain-containing protein n=1 Tax=Humicola insolens TaxID=85995 RepID=A0ABR3VP62_HUMIN